jgi:hypothetical protein
MIRYPWMSCLLALTAAPLGAQVTIAPTRAEKLEALGPTAGTRLREALGRPAPNYTLTVRTVFPNEGQVIDIFFDAAPEATTYSLRRASSPEGPWTTLPPARPA